MFASKKLLVASWYLRYKQRLPKMFKSQRLATRAKNRQSLWPRHKDWRFLASLCGRDTAIFIASRRSAVTSRQLIAQSRCLADSKPAIYGRSDPILGLNRNGLVWDYHVLADSACRLQDLILGHRGSLQVAPGHRR